MFKHIMLLFSWLPTGLALIVSALISLFVLSFFLSLLLRIIEIIRG